MSQPAAPAATMVTTLFLINLCCGDNVGTADPLLHIRSAILKTSQPRAAKPTPQKSMTEATVFPLLFYRMLTTLAVRRQVTNC